MHIVMLAGECVPYAKVGGLADVLGALPRELERLGFSVTVVIPRYRSIDLAKFGFEPVEGFGFRSFDVHRSVLPCSSAQVFLIGHDGFFGRRGIYTDPVTGWDFPDQADRWIFFQRSALEFISAALPKVDILHCHDHQTGLVPAYLERFYRGYAALADATSVFTIHNMGYQGVFPADTMARTGFNPAEFAPMSAFEFYGMLNFMKVGVVFARVVTTVSETYATEIQQSKEFGYGLEGVVRSRPEAPIGIPNGIDYDIWNPATDALLAATYTQEDLEGKRKNKEAVYREFGLDEGRLDRPLLAMISRIDVQKGIDLLIAVLRDVLSQDVTFVMLGAGNKDAENQIDAIVSEFPRKAALKIGYDDRLAHLMEAGADIFLMPSKYEPCGLNQMYSMRYGTPPVVRATGGLADTVQEFDPATGLGTGFRFGAYDPLQFKETITRALRYYRDKPTWQRIMINGMQSDFSWARSARRYADLYERFRKV
ncbi:MAG TPA: glycogen/starch synthase [Terriglobia bacterium]|nr:glycogen/starch synthase [Terriglobia bacterium]